jgi:hypothetical protein
MTANRIDTFQQAFRNLQLQPLVTPKETADFRVAYGEELLADLNQMVLDSTEYNNQLVFAGHRGCGNYRPDDPKQQEFLDLLHNIYAIEYRNTDSWYDLHPLMIEQLKREGVIP